MQELILSTRVVGAKGDGDDEGDSSLSGEAVRNTNDRRTDPNISCICERASERAREREKEKEYWGYWGFSMWALGKSEETREGRHGERERERERREKGNGDCFSK
jgi:hypothetical protein